VEEIGLKSALDQILAQLALAGELDVGSTVERAIRAGSRYDEESLYFAYAKAIEGGWIVSRCPRGPVRFFRLGATTPGTLRRLRRRG